MRAVWPETFLTWKDVIAIIFMSIPAFYLLGTPAIYIWDEAVYANASWDISKGGSLIVPEAGHYNTKPPLVLWLQAVCLLIFSSPEWAIRLPSALSVTGILILLAVFLKRWKFPLWCRILVMAVFVCNEGFIRHHISRTGDLDAVMTFFVTGYCLTALDAIRFERWSGKHLFYFFLFLICSFYSKSIAGWLMLGPLLVVWMLSPSRHMLADRKFIGGLIISIITCMVFYFIRESGQPGMIRLAWNSEYLRMFKNIMPWHEHGFGYYFQNFVSLRTYYPWIFLTMTAMFYFLFIIKEKSIRNEALRWIILSLGYLLVISLPAVKLEWYDAPVYPFFAMLLGVACWHTTRRYDRLMVLWLIPVLFLWYMKMRFVRVDVEPRHPFEYPGAFLRSMDVNENTKAYMPVETPEHRLQLDFYRKVIADGSGEYIEAYEKPEQIQSGDEVILCGDDQSLKSNIDSVVQDTFGEHCVLLKIK